MTEFIKKPNLPERKVKKIICGTDDSKILKFFEKEEIDVISIAPNINVDNAVSRHADMFALHLGENKVIIDKAQKELYNALISLGMDVLVTEKEIYGIYPGDVGLNFALFGDFAVGNFKFADKVLPENINSAEMINVRQGYAKCSILIVNKNTIITDDESIHRKVVEKGINSLLISKGDVFLEGHEYGFIGGASGKLSDDTVVFFGNIEFHRDYKLIKAFLGKNNCKFVCTDDGKLRDIGGFISLI